MNDLARITIDQYDRMISAGVFEPKDNHPWELIRGVIRNWEGPAKFSIADYDRMLASGVFDFPEKQRVELIRGELRMICPINPPHESVVDFFNYWSIRNAPPEKVRVRIQNSLGLHRNTTVPQPDVFWVRKADYSCVRPTSEDVYLLIEISESSVKFDRGEKAELYAQEEIADYWVVNVIDRTVEIFRQPENGKFQSVERFDINDTISPLKFPEVSLQIADIWPAK